MNHYKNNLLEELHRLTEAVQASHADIAPTYLEYTQLAFAIATDCGEAGRADFMSLCSLSPKHDSAAAEKLFSNALHTCKGDIHLGSVFHLAEMCGGGKGNEGNGTPLSPTLLSARSRLARTAEEHPLLCQDPGTA